MSDSYLLVGGRTESYGKHRDSAQDDRAYAPGWAEVADAQIRQKSYADRRHFELEFQVNDFVLLKVSPWKGVIRFRKRGKLGPKYICSFRVIA